MDTSLQSSSLGMAVNETFRKAMPATPQQEAQFRMALVDSYNFKSILKRSRNLFRISIKEHHENKVKIDRDVWAKGQFMISIFAKSASDAERILRKNMQTIRDYFNEEEVSRLKKQYRIKPQNKLMEQIKEEYGLDILVPPGFVQMDSSESGFWLKKEKSVGEHQIIQGLLFYAYPYNTDTALYASNMVEQRDLVSRDFLKGVRENSYMQVYREYSPVMDTINLKGRYAVEYRGLWNMVNDFMGGSFIHYSWIDEQKNQVLNLDGFVYAPKFNKREYLRELEAIIKTLNQLDEANAVN